MEAAMPGHGEKATNSAEYTLLNCEGISRDTFIYRIIPKDRLFALFSTCENVLVRPAKWEDPFENFILNSPVQTEAGETGQFSFHDDFYGQCWTLHKASDAMWRIYSPNKDAVRIRTSIDKLARSLSGPLGTWAHVQCFLGKVDYLSERRLKTFAATVFKNGLSPAALAHSLLVKRAAFRHEREIRLLYLEKNKIKHPNGLYRVAVDPHVLVDQIMIDPRLPKSEADAFGEKIKKKTGFQGELKRSLLYAPPRGFVTRIP